MNTRLLFNVSAAIELLTGLAMLVTPAFLIGLLLGDGLGPTGVAVTRVLGIALLSVGAAIVFLVLGMSGEMQGILLWPAALLHAVVGAAMLAAFFR